MLKEGSMLLEVKLPRGITKSPIAMEVFLTSLWQKGGVNLIDGYVKGKVRPWFSLEIVSIDGHIHFYIWCQPKFKDLVEAQLYAQYPTVEISEVEDYTRHTTYNDEKNVYWASSFKLAKADAYPIRTFVDYGLDKLGTEEEYKTDPITTIIETLGSLQAGEQLWFQILIQAHREEGLSDGRLSKKEDWKKAGEAEIKKIMEKATDKESKQVRLSSMQTDAIKAIERSLNKFAFDTGIRAIYIASKESDRKARRIAAILGVFRPFGSNANYFNNIVPGKGVGFEYPWQDFKGKKSKFLQKSFLEAFKERSFFNGRYKHFRQDPFILTTEEVATIYHFPGDVAQTPTLSRVESRKSEAPSNLPI